jgi:hypothetical protein
VLRRVVVAGLVSAATCGCGGSQPRTYAHAVTGGGPSTRIEERALSDRPPLSIIGRQGDPEAAIALASLASGSAELHAAFGEVLRERVGRAGFPVQLVSHGLGFELVVLVESPDRARQAVQVLLRGLTQPVSQNELPAGPSAQNPQPSERGVSAIGLCSAELSERRRITDAAELERERVASFAQDRAALSVVGDDTVSATVADALADGPDWPERGRVRSILPKQSVSQVLRGERATLSFAVTAGDANRVLSAATRLGAPDGALAVRLAALGAGLRVRRVTATAHPAGACLRIDSDVDASPLPDVRRLGFALQLMEEEASLALSRASTQNRLAASALSAVDPRAAARAAAYGALLAPAPDLTPAELVALVAPEEAPSAPSIDLGLQQARAQVPELDTQVRVEAGQPGLWALIATPCAAASERGENAGLTALLLAAASQSHDPRVRLEPWVGAEGAGLLGFVEREAGESHAQAAERLGNALGQALVAPPSAIDVAAARGELLRAAGSEPRPLFDAVLEALVPGHAGALAPRGTAVSLQAASRDAVLTRQRELLRLSHRLAILSPTDSADAAQLTRNLSRWLKTPDAPRPSPCASELGGPARSELRRADGSTDSEGAYVAFRLSAKAGAEASVLADLLNLPGGALVRALAEPDLVGAARALVVGTSSARALIVQVSAFEGREPEALSRIQKLFERLASGGVLIPAELDAALAQRKNARRLAALDPRFRLVQMLDASASTPLDAAAVRRLAQTLRPESALVARSSGPARR